MASCSRVEKVKLKEKENMFSLLDLPKLGLECIFERLSPADLCSMVRVCSVLREMCSSDHLWERHLQQKWGKVIGDAAYREWRSNVASKIGQSSLSKQKKEKGVLESLRNSRRLSWIGIKPEKSSKVRTTLPVDSVMAFYFALESGKFWFPAQIYYRQNGYTGVMLLCYDAQISYDSRTNTFRARYTSQGWGTGEENIGWDRVRAPPVGVPLDPFVPHVSDCLHDLKPGDHIEIQWKSRTDLPYAWWYALIGHLEPCDKNQNHCLCHENDTIVVEFNQYHPTSRWRRTTTSRKYHPRQGNEIDGFYGGIRKLSDQEEIAKWLSFWPNHVLIRVRFPNVNLP
ncbi:F-box protein [Morus notabilis]|uniref:F-box protein n=1 Tax=Morus notabilis TaxID=981085 RepID=W9SBZ7_9ROSA|nr:F-box protein [Morus notabilis]